MASTESVNVLCTELNNLKKCELIEIIVNQNLSPKVSNEMVKNCVKELREALHNYRKSNLNNSSSSNDSTGTVFFNTQETNEKDLGFLASQDPGIPENTLTQEGMSNGQAVVTELLRELSVVRNENNFLKKIETQMTERIDLMVFKINVLEIRNESGTTTMCNNENSKSKQMPPNSSEGTPLHGPQPLVNMVSSNGGDRHTQTKNKVDSAIYRTTSNAQEKYQKPSSPSLENWQNKSKIDHGLIGTRQDENCPIAAAEKSSANLTFLHVSNLKSNTDEKMLKDFMKMDGVTVNKLNSNDFSSSFKIGAPKESLETLLDAEFWPVGVKIRRFQFNSNKNKEWFRAFPRRQGWPGKTMQQHSNRFRKNRQF